MKTNYLFTILALFFAVTFIHAQTIVPPGKVEGRWTLDKSPFTIEGAIYVNNGTTLFIEPGVEVIFKTNDRVNIHGRLHAVGTEKQPIRFTAVDKNEGWGGIWWPRTSSDNDTSKLFYCHFEYGRAQSESPYNSGGVVGVRNFSKLLIRHCTFEYNKALHHSKTAPSGGAISLWYSDIRISHCIFRYNLAAYGGALAINGYSKPIIDNCLFYSNCVSSYGGAVEVYDHSKPTFVSCTFADNHAVYSGGAFDNCLSSGAYLLNCIVWYNTAGMSGDQVNIRSEGSTIKMYYCNLEGGVEAISGFPIVRTFKAMLNAYPIFLYTTEGPYTLSPFSPCLETGSIDCKYFPDGWCCPCSDLANTMRVCNQQIDIGCYEFKASIPPGEDDIVESGGLKVTVFPSPIKSSTTIEYELLETKLVKLKVYDMQGRVVSETPLAVQKPGMHQINWDAQLLPKGIYVYKLKAGNKVNSGQLIVTK